MALDATTTAALRRRDDDLVRVSSSSAPARSRPLVSAQLRDLFPQIGTTSWSDYAFGVIWAIGEAGLAVSGLDVYLESTVPIGAGALVVCNLGVRSALHFETSSRPSFPSKTLPCFVQRAENAYVGVPSGIMDQTASLCCIAGHAILFDTRSGEIEQLGFDLAPAGLELLVIDTRVRHQLATSAYADRRAACELAAKFIGVRSLRDATLRDLAKIPDEGCPSGGRIT